MRMLVEKEKRAVASVVSGLTTAFAKARHQHWTAECPSEIILALRSLGYPVSIIEKVISVQDIIAQVVEQRPVKLVRA